MLFREKAMGRARDLLAHFVLSLPPKGHDMAAHEGDRSGSKVMSGIFKLLVLTFFGLAAGIVYNEWSASLPETVGGPGQPLTRLDLQSYGVGLVAGIVLWQIGAAPWNELPGRVRRYLLSKTYIYQFIVVSAACVAVLIYL
jgi:hypothetical protein